VGTGAHLTGELFRSTLGLDLVHVPYGGGGPAIAAAVAGHTPFPSAHPPRPFPQIAMASCALLRSAGRNACANYRTFRPCGSGFTDVECDVWLGVLLPAHTPKEIVMLMNNEINWAVAQAGRPGAPGRIWF